MTIAELKSEIIDLEVELGHRSRRVQKELVEKKSKPKSKWSKCELEEYRDVLEKALEEKLESKIIKKYDNLEKYRDTIVELFRIMYSLPESEVDDDSVKSAFDGNEHPYNYAEGYGEKYDLERYDTDFFSEVSPMDKKILKDARLATGEYRG